MEHLLSCDWGSSAFRLRAVSLESGDILAEIRSDRGATVLAGELPRDASPSDRASAFAGHLGRMLGQLQDQTALNLAGLPVVVSGMATSAHGWRELPYAPVPFSLDGSGLVWHEITIENGDGPHRPVFLLSGVTTGRDVMRGEEAELVGLFQFDAWHQYATGALVVLPGTHSKHVIVQDGHITDFTTHMTGELFSVLSRHSVLSRSVELNERSAAEGTPPHLPAFREGVRAAGERGLSAGLFEVRVNGLLDRYPPGENASFLSGLLIGGELFDLSRKAPQLPVLLCGEAPLQALYGAALEEIAVGCKVLALPPEVSGRSSSLGHKAFILNQI